MSHAAKIIGTLTDAGRCWLWRIVGRGSTFHRMHGRLITEVTLQQRANRRKKRRLRLMHWERSQRRVLEKLNMVHVEWLTRLECEHPELQAEIASHQHDRREADSPSSNRS